MKLFPSRLKYKKNHRRSTSNFSLKESKNFYPLKGSFTLILTESGKLNFKQIEACRKSVRRSLRKEGGLIMRLFTDFSKTSKPLGSRMGKGKGNHDVWICHVHSGQIICEIFGIREPFALFALHNAGTKLPLRTKVSRIIY